MGVFRRWPPAIFDAIADQKLVKQEPWSPLVRILTNNYLNLNSSRSPCQQNVKYSRVYAWVFQNFHIKERIFFILSHKCNGGTTNWVAHAQHGLQCLYSIIMLKVIGRPCHTSARRCATAAAELRSLQGLRQLYHPPWRRGSGPRLYCTVARTAWRRVTGKGIRSLFAKFRNQQNRIICKNDTNAT